MKILITGAQGQLGTELRHLLDAQGVAYRATDAHDLDITDETAVNQYFKDYQPELVYHCAAYTAVDKAEGEAKAINQKVNVDGTRNLAKAAAEVDATLVYISKDYVAYTHLRAHETDSYIVCRLLLEKKKKHKNK